MPGVGVADSAEEAVTYIMSLSRDVLEERLVRAYVEAGAEMVGFLDPEAGGPGAAPPLGHRESDT
jgi:hypothetical protein